MRRTFQNVRLFSTHDGVRERRGRRPRPRAQGTGCPGATEGILAWSGLDRLADTTAGSLPYGLERRLGIARVLVADPRYVLLDEPAAGLNEAESDDLLTLLRGVPQRFGCGVMVIEHDMRLIMRLCDRLHVVNYGRTLAVGDPSDVRRNPAVIEAYLGGTTGSRHE